MSDLFNCPHCDGGNDTIDWHTNIIHDGYDFHVDCEHCEKEFAIRPRIEITYQLLNKKQNNEYSNLNETSGTTCRRAKESARIQQNNGNVSNDDNVDYD